MIKKILFLLIFCLASFNVACGDKEENNQTPDVPTVEEPTPDEPVEPTIPNENDYSVKVVYPDGTAVKGGVKVKWCTIENCSTNIEVNENGVATISTLQPGEYVVHIDRIPDGYTYNPNNNIATEDNKNIEISLISLKTISEGEGTMENPYKLSDGAYNLTYESATVSGIKYFAFIANETKEYELLSLAEEIQSIHNIDPYLGFWGDSFENDRNIDGNLEKLNNFSLKFHAEAGKTYYFGVFVSSANRFPATFAINIK